MRSPALLFFLLATPGLAAVHLGAVHQFGGSESEVVAAMVRDTAGNLYLTGKTYSYDFPANVLQTHPGGSNLWRVAAPAAPAPIYTHRAGTIFDTAADRAHPGALFLWTGHGLLRSSDYGATWTADAIGLPAPSGGSLAIDPRDGATLYLADPNTGIYKSSNAGATWTLIPYGPPPVRGYFPDRILLDPANPAILLAIQSYYGPTLYRSADSGATWQLQSASIYNIAFDATRPGVVYAIGPNQIFRSSDHGATFTRLAAPASFFNSLAVDSSGNIYYAEQGSTAGITVSRDGGLTWTNHPFNGYIVAITADPDSPAVYAATSTQVFSSLDGFATSTTIAVPPFVSRLTLAPAPVPHAPGVLFTSTYGASADAYVMKLDPAGNLLWATYLGGNQDDAGTGIALDSLGNVYIAGSTASPDFPTTPGALTPAGGAANFVAKLSPDGRLLYSATFTDGGAIDALAVDSAGNAYLAGTITEYQSTGFFSFPNPYASICKLDASGSHFLFCNKLTSGRAYSIAVDPAGNAYLGGEYTLWKVNPAGAFVYQRAVKGTVLTLALDARQSLYAAGNTTALDFPTTPGAFQTQFNTYRNSIAGALNAYSNDHGFIQRLATDTGDVLASTLLEGENWEHVLAVAIDSAGNVTAAGATASNSFPLSGAFQTRFGYYTGFVSRLSGDLSSLLFSTYVGDNRNFQVSGLALAGDGSVLFAGDTSNASSFFGGTNVPAAASDIFVVALELVPSAPPLLRGVVNAASQVGTRIASNQYIAVLADGAAPDAQVHLDGQSLPTLPDASSPGRILARIPIDYPVTGAASLRVQSGSQLSDPLLIAGATANPAIYTRDGSGSGEALVYHEDGSLNSPDNPAAPGSIIAIACNGVGRITFDGDYAVAETPVSVYVDGFYANGVDAHMLQLPGIPGDTYVIRVYVPNPQIDGFSMPPTVSLTLNIGGTANTSGILSQPGVSISIKQ